MVKLKVLELYSGIGGMHYALKGRWSENKLSDIKAIHDLWVHLSVWIWKNLTRLDHAVIVVSRSIIYGYEGVIVLNSYG